MKAWWEGLGQRERWLLLGGVAGTLLLLVYALVWEPFHSRLQALRHTVAEQRAEIAWMRQAASEVKRLTETVSTPQAPRRLDGRSLLTLVDQTARAAGLGSAVKRVEPQGEEMIRIRLEQVEFDEMVRWLGGLRTEYGVQIVNAIIDRQPVDGRVDARLILQGSRT